MRGKIAFFRMAKWNYPDQRLPRILQQNYPDYEVETIELVPLLKRSRLILLINFFCVLKEYGLDILLGRKSLKACFFRTPYIFKKMKALAADRLSRDKYAFSIQIQSLFDASTAGIPHFVYTDHTHLANLHYADFDCHQLYSRSWIELEKTIYHNATRVLTRSSHISKSVVEDYGCEPAKVVCVYAGGNAPAGNWHPDNEHYGNKNILFVGIDWERKGGPELVEAFRSVLQIHPDAQLTIVGCSPDVDVPNCRAVGKVSLEEVSRHFREASIFCLPTKREPFGTVFVEALTHKLPIVATNIGALPDLVTSGMNGELVEPNDVDQLATTLLGFVGDPQRCRRFGESGYRLAKERYNWERTGTTIRSIINAAV